MERGIDIKGMIRKKGWRKCVVSKYEKQSNDCCSRSPTRFHSKLSLWTQPYWTCVGTRQTVHKEALWLHFCWFRGPALGKISVNRIRKYVRRVRGYARRYREGFGAGPALYNVVKQYKSYRRISNFESKNQLGYDRVLLMSVYERRSTAHWFTAATHAIALAHYSIHAYACALVLCPDSAHVGCI